MTMSLARLKALRRHSRILLAVLAVGPVAVVAQTRPPAPAAGTDGVCTGSPGRGGARHRDPAGRHCRGRIRPIDARQLSRNQYQLRRTHHLRLWPDVSMHAVLPAEPGA
jgi:hypothetical protein